MLPMEYFLTAIDKILKIVIKEILQIPNSTPDNDLFRETI